MISRDRLFNLDLRSHDIFKLFTALAVGLLLGLFVVLNPYLPISNDYQKIILVLPFAATIAILFNDPDKLILAAIAIGVPLNMDVSLIISPYARNYDNLRRGFRTLIALTELRVSFVTIALLIGYAIWIFRLRDHKYKPVRFFPATTIPALVYIFFTALSVIEAQDQQLWFFRTAQLVEMFFAYFYLANHLRTDKQAKFFLLFWLGGLAAESVLILIQWVTGLQFQMAGLEAVSFGAGREAGTLGNPGPAGGFLSVLTLIAFAMIWVVPKRSHQALTAVVAGLGAIALVGTGSRIGWVGFAVSMALFLLFGLRKGWIKGSTIVILGLCALLVGGLVFGTVYNRLTEDDNGSVDARFMMWTLAWNVIKANPWLGVGAGNYALVTREYFTPDMGNASQVLDIQVHNAFMNIWAEAGIFALLSYLALLGAAALRAWSVNKSNSRFLSLTGTALSLSIVSLGIQMFTGTFHMRPITLFVWVLLAVAACLPYIKQPDEQPAVKTRDLAL